MLTATLVALSVATTPSACPGATTVPTAGSAVAATRSVTCLINSQRARRGLQPIGANGRLREVAGRLARDMVKRDYLSHVTPGGSTLRMRLDRAHYADGKPIDAGEIIGAGVGRFGTPAGIVKAWLHSPPHRAIMLSPQFRELGAAVTAGAPKVAGGHSGIAGATYAVDFGVVL